MNTHAMNIIKGLEDEIESDALGQAAHCSGALAYLAALMVYGNRKDKEWAAKKTKEIHDVGSHCHEH